MRREAEVQKLREAPSAEKDYGKRSVVKAARKRREDYCNEADFPLPSTTNARPQRRSAPW